MKKGVELRDIAFLKDKIRILPAEKDDATAISELLKKQLDEHHLPISISDLRAGVDGVFADSGRGFLLVAKAKDRIIGVTYISFVWTLEHGGPGAWLEEMFMLPEWRNKGIGTRMLELAIEECSKRGCQGIDLEVDSNHKAVENLYRRFGFSPLNRNRWVKKPGK